MQDIKNYNTFTKIEPVNKGWSNDKKYYIETADGGKLLLRVADISEYDRTLEKWQLSEELYKVALKAVSNERNQRQQSIQQFIEEWNEAKTTTVTV